MLGAAPPWASDSERSGSFRQLQMWWHATWSGLSQKRPPAPQGLRCGCAHRWPREAGNYAGHPAKSPPQDQAGLRFRERNLIERFFNKIKHFRAIATRYDKLATNFLAAVQLVSAIILLD